MSRWDKFGSCRFIHGIHTPQYFLTSGREGLQKYITSKNQNGNWMLDFLIWGLLTEFQYIQRLLGISLFLYGPHLGLIADGTVLCPIVIDFFYAWPVRPQSITNVRFLPTVGYFVCMPSIKSWCHLVAILLLYQSSIFFLPERSGVPLDFL